MISLIAAMDRNRNIGLDGDMPWGSTMKADLKRFKQLTEGHTIIMGRKTFESLPTYPYPLPKRKHIILTTDQPLLSMSTDHIAFVESLEKALGIVDEDRLAYAKAVGNVDEFETFVIGGATIYEQFLPHADRVYLTRINSYFEGDTKFPSIIGKWNIIENEPHKSDENNPYGYTFMTYERGESR